MKGDVAKIIFYNNLSFKIDSIQSSLNGLHIKLNKRIQTIIYTAGGGKILVTLAGVIPSLSQSIYLTVSLQPS